MSFRAVFFGHHNMGALCLESLLALGASVSLVVVNRPYAGENVWYRSVAETASSAGVPVVEVEDLDAAALTARVRAAAPDFIFSVGFRRLIPVEALAAARGGAVNLHDSLLPRYRGFTPSTWAIINGETETGVTMHWMEAAADAGGILSQIRVPIAADDTGFSLSLKLGEAGRTLFCATVPALAAGRLAAAAQDESAATWFGRRGRRVEDDLIDWSWPAERVHDLVRAITRPLPGAFACLGAGRVRIWRGVVERRLEGGWGHLPPGAVLAADGDGLLVICGSGLYRAVEFTLEEGLAAPRAGDCFHGMEMRG